MRESSHRFSNYLSCISSKNRGGVKRQARMLGRQRDGSGFCLLCSSWLVCSGTFALEDSEEVSEVDRVPAYVWGIVG